MRRRSAFTLEQAADDADIEISTRASAYLASFTEASTRRLELAEHGRHNRDARVSALARALLGEEAMNSGTPDDEAHWTDDLNYAVEHGDAKTAAAAALDLGAAYTDSATAFRYLELALRSPMS